ncbi:MAG: hypothetical protein ABI234_02125 [Ktedonobacteraceae bacterium]
MRLADTDACYNASTVKLMVRHHIHTPEDLHARVVSLVGAAYSVTYSGGPFLEIATARYLVCYGFTKSF